MLKNRIKNGLVLSLLMLALFGSCKKNDDVINPTLISFGPSTVKHGDTIKFIGVGLDQITDIIMPVRIDIGANSFITHTSKLIELVVPQTSTVGHVILKTNKGDSIISKTVFGAAYTIAVRSFTPTTAKPGTTITINGDFLNYVKQVTFAQGQAATQFVSQSVHQLVVQVPMTAQTGPISLTDLATTPQVVDQDTLNNDLILNVMLPATTSFSPASVEQTTNLTITGTNLDLVAEIDFSTSGTTVVKAIPPFGSQSATQIVVTVPNAAITGPLTLVAPSGIKVVTPSITVTEPVVTDMPVGRNGAQIAIAGTDLNLVASILFPDGGVGTPVASTSFVSQSSTSIDVTIPASAIPGTLQVVTTHGFTVSAPNFKITLPVATVYSTTTPGDPMTITGTDLDLVTAIIFPDKSQVVSSSFTSQSPTSINVTIPSTATAGTLTFVIANGYQTVQGVAFGGCSTYFSGGTVLYSFDSDLQGWFGDNQYSSFSGTSSLTATYTNSVFHSCVGSLQSVMNFTSNDTGKNAEVEINTNSTPLSYAGKSKVHFWVKLAGAANVNNVQLYIQMGGWNYQSWWYGVSTTLSDGGSLSDGNWHDLVADLTQTLVWDGSHNAIPSAYLNEIDQIGVQVVAGNSSTGPVTLYVDDIWIE